MLTRLSITLSHLSKDQNIEAYFTKDVEIPYRLTKLDLLREEYGAGGEDGEMTFTVASGYFDITALVYVAELEPLEENYSVENYEDTKRTFLESGWAQTYEG